MNTKQIDHTSFKMKSNIDNYKDPPVAYSKDNVYLM